jgi:DNA-binding XRE family transcriptional regulator
VRLGPFMEEHMAPKHAAHKPAPGIALEKILADRLRSPEFRDAFRDRRMVHGVAVAVRAMREQAGLTQVALAKKIGSSQPSVARIEKGLGYRTPQWETLNRIARALGRQMKLSFIEADTEEPLVEVDGLPTSPPG